MKIKVNDKIVLELSNIQKKVIQNDISGDIFEEDMKRRVKYILTHKYQQCFKRLKEEWEPILKKRLESIPTKDDELAQLIFSQPEYKNKKEREELRND